MQTTSRATQICMLKDLNPGLKAVLKAHVAQYQLDAGESDIIMCCETTSIRQKNRWFGATKNITHSAAYMTPKWLIWADNTAHSNACVGSAQLKHIDVQDYETTAMYVIAVAHGLNVTGRYTDRNKAGMTFIVLGSDPDGHKFREALDEAMKKAAHQ
jgi:hypothetical protein